MTATFSAVLDTFIIFSVYYLVMLAVSPMLRRRFSARACSALWLVPCVMLFSSLVLFDYNAYGPLLTLYIPKRLLTIFIYVWIAGAAAVIVCRVASHRLFRRNLMYGIRRVRDEALLDIWDSEKSAIVLSRPVRLMVSSKLTAPLSTGITDSSRMTVLPDKDYTEAELRLIFRHELRHIQRHDIETKASLMFCTAVCWWNPLVWLAVKKAEEDMERSCDEIVMAGADAAERRRYAELLLSTAGSARGFTTCLSATASSLRYRLKSIMTAGKRRTGTLLIAAVMFVSVVCCGIMDVSCYRGSAAGSGMLDGVEASDITSLLFRSGDETITVPDWDGRRLYDYIMGIEVEQLASQAGKITGADPSITAVMARDGELDFISLSSDMLGLSGGCFLVRSDVDCDYIRSCLTMEPRTTSDDPPELTVMAEGSEIRAECISWTVEDGSGAELTAYTGVGEPPVITCGGFAEAEYAFSTSPFTVELIAYSMTGNPAFKRTGEKNHRSGSFALAGFSARYVVKALFFENGNMCRGEWAFYAELSEG